MELLFSKLAIAFAMVGLASVAAYLEVNGKDDNDWLWLAVFVLFLSLGQNN